MHCQAPVAASASTPDATSAAPPPASRAAVKYRRELFCQHLASGASGAEAVRRAGYSPKGAKQRASYLLTLPEIRLRIEALRAGRRAVHDHHLADAIAVVDRVIADAAQQAKGSVVLRAVEFKLKLHGVIKDKRIDHYAYADRPSPDADLETADCNPKEELDGIPGHEHAHFSLGTSLPPGFAMPAQPPALVPAPAPVPAAEEAAPEEVLPKRRHPKK